MQAKAPRLRELRGREAKRLEEFAKGLGVNLSAIARRPMALEVPEGEYVDVFDVPSYVEAALGSIGSAYAAGYYLGFIDKDGFHPGLTLAQRLERLCFTAIDCIVLDEWGTKVFLYGKEVYGDHIIKFREGLAVVLDPSLESIGWGVGARITLKTRHLTKVEPVKDLGWYLRRGG